MGADATPTTPPLRWLAPVGLLVALFGLVSYFAFFARFPALRDQPWLNLGLVAAGTAAAAVAFWRRRGVLRAGAVLLSLAAAGLLFWYVFGLSAELPSTENVLAIGATAPDFSLLDANGHVLDSADFGDRALLLVFYRGFW